MNSEMKVCVFLIIGFMFLAGLLTFSAMNARTKTNERMRMCLDKKLPVGESNWGPGNQAWIGCRANSKYTHD